VERNPYVPGQTTLSPIRNWRALEVMLYLRWNELELNPLYEQDLERIGCWLCPSSLQSEFSHLKESHPVLHAQWTSCLEAWAKRNDLEDRYIDWGFWRWKAHPPKMLQLARDHHINLEMGPAEGRRSLCRSCSGERYGRSEPINLQQNKNSVSVRQIFRQNRRGDRRRIGHQAIDRERSPLGGGHSSRLRQKQREAGAGWQGDRAGNRPTMQGCEWIVQIKTLA